MRISRITVIDGQLPQIRINIRVNIRTNIRVNIRVNFENGGKENPENDLKKKISRTEWIF